MALAMDSCSILLQYEGNPKWVFLIAGIGSCCLLGKNNSAILIDLKDIIDGTDDIDLIVEYLKYLDTHELVHWAIDDVTEYWNEYLIHLLIDYMPEERVRKFGMMVQ